MSFKAVVFDLFGTLIDFLPDAEYDENGRRMAEALGVPAVAFREAWMATSPERNRGLFGDMHGDVRAVCERIGQHPGDGRIADAVRIRLEIARRNHQPRPDAIPTIERLKSAGLKVGLLSDTPSDTTAVWLESPFSRLMDAAILSCEVGICKPDPRVYAMVCDRLGVGAADCLYVGDGGSRELTGAKAFGMSPVLIKDGLPGFGRRQDALEWKGAVIHRLGEVPALCGI